MEVDVTVLSNNECKNEYDYVPSWVTSNMVCAWGNGKDACQGDSGGTATLVYILFQNITKDTNVLGPSTKTLLKHLTCSLPTNVCTIRKLLGIDLERLSFADFQISNMIFDLKEG